MVVTKEITMDTLQLKETCRRIRLLTTECIASRGLGHIGGSLSAVEALVVLYYDVMRIDPAFPGMPGRDRFVLSKGHSGPALYAVLADRGYFDPSLLRTLNRPETILPSHCDRNRTPGVDMTTGSLGQGFSCAVGLAIGSQLQGDQANIYAMLGDGELQEGQIWEAAMLAGNRGLDNLIALVDWNKMQLDGLVEDVNGIMPLADKWKAFNWDVIHVPDGNDVEQVRQALRQARDARNGRPKVVLLETVKGKGVSFAEQAGVNSHNMPVTEQMYLQAVAELT